MTAYHSEDENELADAKRDAGAKNVGDLIRKRIASGECDLRDVGQLLTGKWDQDVPAAMLAALPGTVQPVAVAVKPLEWVSVGRKSVWAETSIGTYEVAVFEAAGLNTRLKTSTTISWFPDEEAAKAAAQADFEARIRSSLIPATMAGDGGWRPTHVHVKRGTTYRVIDRAARLQTNGTLADNEVMVIYEGEDGQRWVRADYEFEDGRFAALANPRLPGEGSK